MIHLEIPNHQHRWAYETMLEIWKEHENISDMSPCALFVGGNFDEFLIQTQNFRQNPPEGFVLSTLFFVMKDNEIIGWVDIRHNIWTEYLKNFGGHIGYGILPTERGKWYATQALAHAVQEAKNLITDGDKILLVCDGDDDKLASARVIEKNSWKLDNIIPWGDKKIRRYWINL